MSMTLRAWDEWLKTETGARMTIGLHRSRVADIQKAFVAGWNAGRAEARSDAAEPEGGRVTAYTTPYTEIYGRTAVTTDGAKVTRKKLDADGNWQDVEGQ